MIRIISLVVAFAIVWPLSPALARAAAIVNGDFESGDFTGWTVGSPTRAPQYAADANTFNKVDVSIAAVAPNAGLSDYVARLSIFVPGIPRNSPVDPGALFTPFISQTFTAPFSGTISFDAAWRVAPNSSIGTGGFQVSLDGPGDSDPYSFFTHTVFGSTTGPWQTYSFALPVAGQYTLKISPVMNRSLEVGSYVGGIAEVDVDNVRLELVPEPATWLMLSVGAVFFLTLRKRCAFRGE
jgi:hypothetical protein